METQRGSTSLQWWSLLLLLGLVVPPAAAKAFSYQEAVLRAVDGLNQQSSDANLYRLLKLNQQPSGDENPNTPKPVNFTVKETVCPRRTKLPAEQCDFKKNGLVKHCVGTVTLDQTTGFFDINCDRPRHVRRIRGLRKFFRKSKEKLKKVGRKVKGFFRDVLRRVPYLPGPRFSYAF
ncbi:cathelicidin antimicrobial peptide [Loxodonta africana]|nr:cathelicidin antimicrobial peptide [Loxodonta africana]